MRNLYSIKLPNMFNISIDFPYLCYICMAIYPPGEAETSLLFLWKIIIYIICLNLKALYVMYTHMLVQRKKVLNRPHKDQSNKIE